LKERELSCSILPGEISLYCRENWGQASDGNIFSTFVTFVSRAFTIYVIFG
jgi:hypothetical protein